MTHEPFEPVAPEPYGDATEPFYAADPEPGPARPMRTAPAASRVLGVALGLAVLVGASGVAFAAGRASAPAAADIGSRAGVVNPGGTGVAPNAGGPRAGGGLPGASGGLPGGGDDNGGGNDDGRRAFGGPGGFTLAGTVASVTAGALTVTLPGGQSVTVSLDASTTYHQQAAASSSDVAPGDSVRVQLAGGFRQGRGGTAGGPVTLGTAGDITIVP